MVRIEFQLGVDGETVSCALADPDSGCTHAGSRVGHICRSSHQASDGSTITAAQIDETVTRLMRAAKVTGVGIAIFDPRTVQLLKSYGFRDKDNSLPLTPDSVMSAASFTKVAFAYAVMTLVDGGVLELDKPIQEYLPKPLPEYPRYADLAGDPRYKRITARMLLSHTSGFANYRASKTTTGCESIMSRARASRIRAKEFCCFNLSSRLSLSSRSSS
jgi:CubicO group peptidase (beta-lactamase class C family)